MVSTAGEMEDIARAFLLATSGKVKLPASVKRFYGGFPASNTIRIINHPHVLEIKRVDEPAMHLQVIVPSLEIDAVEFEEHLAAGFPPELTYQAASAIAKVMNRVTTQEHLPSYLCLKEKEGKQHEVGIHADSPSSAIKFARKGPNYLMTATNGNLRLEVATPEALRFALERHEYATRSRTRRRQTPYQF
ncbi:MAG: hypothetical protein V1644_03230 [Candidatus Micrarchaeota archaeon]